MPSRRQTAKLCCYCMQGDGTGGIQASKLGMRVQKGQTWANLRLASFASGVAGYYVTLKGVTEDDAAIVRSLHRLHTCALRFFASASCVTLKGITEDDAAIVRTPGLLCLLIVLRLLRLRRCRLFVTLHRASEDDAAIAPFQWTGFVFACHRASAFCLVCGRLLHSFRA